MKIFLDSNVWVSAFATQGICEALVRSLLIQNRQGLVELFTASEVLAETRRILVEKFAAPESALSSVATAMNAAVVVKGNSAPSHVPDPDDVPIIAAALAARVALFVTGDKALLDLKNIEDMELIPPGTLYERMKRQQ